MLRYIETRIFYFDGSEGMNMKLLRNVALFRHLSDVQLKIIYIMCTKEKFQAGTVLFRENDPGSVFYIIISGSVKIYTSNAAGEEKILTIVNAGESFGELALIDQGTRSASAQTLDECEMYCLRRDHFMTLLRANFDITQGILVELCARLRETNQHVHDLTFLDERTRIVKSIIQMASRHGRRDGHLIYFQVALNQSELAQLAGVKPDQLNQVIQEFQRRSILRFTDNQYVLDLSALR